MPVLTASRRWVSHGAHEDVSENDNQPLRGTESMTAHAVIRRYPVAKTVLRELCVELYLEGCRDLYRYLQETRGSYRMSGPQPHTSLTEVLRRIAEASCDEERGHVQSQEDRQQGGRT